MLKDLKIKHNWKKSLQKKTKQIVSFTISQTRTKNSKPFISQWIKHIFFSFELENSNVEENERSRKMK